MEISSHTQTRFPKTFQRELHPTTNYLPPDDNDCTGDPPIHQVSTFELLLNLHYAIRLRIQPQPAFITHSKDVGRRKIERPRPDQIYANKYLCIWRLPWRLLHDWDCIIELFSCPTSVDTDCCLMVACWLEPASPSPLFCSSPTSSLLNSC